MADIDSREAAGFSRDTAADARFLLWEHLLLHHPNMSLIIRMYEEFPPPDCPVLLKMQYLRNLEQEKLRRGVDLLTVDMLLGLRKLSMSAKVSPFYVFLADKLPPGNLQGKPAWNELLLATLREITLTHLRSGDRRSFIEKVALYWEKLPSYLGPESEAVQKTQNDFLAVRKKFGKRRAVIQKYPLESTEKLLEAYVAWEWGCLRPSFLKRVSYDLSKGYYKNVEAFLVKHRWDDGKILNAKGSGEAAGIDLSNKDEWDEPGLVRCSAGLNSKADEHLLAKTVKVGAPEVCTSPKAEKQARLVLPVGQATRAEIGFAFPTFREVLEDSRFQETWAAGQASEQSPSKAHTSIPISGEPEDLANEGVPIRPSTARPPEADLSDHAKSNKVLRDGESDGGHPVCRPGKRRKLPSRMTRSQHTADIDGREGTGLDEMPAVVINLRDSSLQLKKLGVDPLPEALAIAKQAGRSYRETESQAPAKEDQSRAQPPSSPLNAEANEMLGPSVPLEAGLSTHHPLHQRTESVDTGVPDRAGIDRRNNSNQANESVRQTEPDVTEHPAAASHVPERQLRKNLMARNASARQLQWDSDNEAEISDPDDVGPPSLDGLHSVRKVSSLEKQAGGTSKVSKRRRMNKGWTVDETRRLLEAVKEQGHHWKLILRSHPDDFFGRSEIDLKDKWRNIQKQKREV